jgi:hypothetical protein
MTNSLGNYDHHMDLLASVRPGNKKALCDALQDAGITKVIVEFDGCGDSGQIEAITAFAGDDTVALPAITIEIAEASWGSPEITRSRLSTREAIEHVAYNYLEEQHGGWEIDGGAFGEFTFDVTSRNIVLTFNARYTDVQTSEYSF